MRSWSLELYSDESKSHVMENGRRVYIYKLRQIDDGEETVPAYSSPVRTARS
ncbi:MAG: hypothetical protein ACLUT5_14130 [Butyricicoccus sp.]